MGQCGSRASEIRSGPGGPSGEKVLGGRFTLQARREERAQQSRGQHSQTRRKHEEHQHSVHKRGSGCCEGARLPGCQRSSFLRLQSEAHRPPPTAHQQQHETRRFASRNIMCCWRHRMPGQQALKYAQPPAFRTKASLIVSLAEPLRPPRRLRFLT